GGRAALSADGAGEIRRSRCGHFPHSEGFSAEELERRKLHGDRRERSGARPAGDAAAAELDPQLPRAAGDREWRAFPPGVGRRGGAMVSFADVAAAHERLKAHARRTPVLSSTTINGMTGGKVYFKCENMQRAGAFKFRGAYNA